jgi:hypothetical protein
MTRCTRTQDVTSGTGDDARPRDHARTGGGDPLVAIDLAAQLYALRVAIGEVDALVAVTVAAYDDADWHATDRLQVVRMAYLLGVIAKAATNAVSAVDQFHAAAADQQPAMAGDQW